MDFLARICHHSQPEQIFQRQGIVHKVGKIAATFLQFIQAGSSEFEATANQAKPKTVNSWLKPAAKIFYRATLHSHQQN
jgi:hypothetical protein